MDIELARIQPTESSNTSQPAASTSTSAPVPNTDDSSQSRTSENSQSPNDSVANDAAQSPDPTPPPVVNQTPAMQVRLSLLRRLFQSMNDTRSENCSSLLYLIVTTLGQAITFSVIAGIAWQDECDRPLDIYLVLTSARLLFTLPVSLYLSFNSRHSGYDASLRPWGNPRLDSLMKKLKDFTPVLSLVLFIIGNSFFFSSTQCRITSPRLWYTSLVALIFSYMYAAEILFIVVAVFLFLPFVYIGVRWFGLGAKKHDIGPLTKSDIRKIPTRAFLNVIPGPASNPTTGEESDANQAGEVTQRKRGWGKLSRLWSSRPSILGRRKPVKVNQIKLPPGVKWISLPENHASCAVCLCDYDIMPTEPPADWKPELLRLLPCGHTFHIDCVDSWLGVSGRCPLCQRPVKEKKDKSSETTEGDDNV